MVQLKAISENAIPSALERALRYRLLNEPLESESICCDVLAADPGNKEALVTLLLALTDQFETDYLRALDRAKEVLPQLHGDYERAYYEGIINERWAKAQAARRMPTHIVAGWFQRAMHCYENAEALCTSDNPDAVLRWNTCARILQRCEDLEPAAPSATWDVEADVVGEPPSA
jgi:erythromycin esterase-like protein